jgi:hypothetical protein
LVPESIRWQAIPVLGDAMMNKAGSDVSPRAGGDADKFGNRYEGRWTVRQLLEVLVGKADAVTVEPLGELSEGVEFTLERGTGTEVHQAKRQYGVASEWDLRTLNARDVLKHAQRHVAAGRRFYFVSITPAALLNELADRARHTSDPQSFSEYMLTSDDLRRGFDYLSGAAYGSASVAWATLRGLYADWTSEESLQSYNEALAGLLLEGAEPRLITAGLGDLVSDNTAVRLDAVKVHELLGPYGLRRRESLGSLDLSKRLREITASWRSSVGGALLQPAILRPESSQLVEQISAGSERVLFVTGAAGGGKSAVLHEMVGQLEAGQCPVLALRLDRLEPFSTSLALGHLLGLEASPVTALAVLAKDTPSLLVIDQLDAVSFASGRMPQTFEVVGDLIREAAAFPEMRIVLACRKFDVDNDYRIRALAASDGVSELEVEPLSDEQVDAAVAAIGLPAATLTETQRRLLRIPLHLVLLRTIADQPGALFFSSSRQLFDDYWDRKRRDCEERRPKIRFAATIGLVAETMSRRRRLMVPRTTLDRDDMQADGDVLISSNVLVLDGSQLAFFHEAFFDYAFARQWINREQTLIEFLLGGEQELFRRSQVRQILMHLRDDDRDRYLSELEALLNHPQVRFHILDTALAFLGSLSEPTKAEWEVLTRLLATAPSFTDRLWLTVRTLPWFDCLDGEGLIETWLASDKEPVQRQALDMIVPAAKACPDRLADLLAPHAGQHDSYISWLAWATRFASLYESRSLFELVLDAVSRGDYAGREQSLWLSSHGLGQHRPQWAVELLTAYLVDRPGALGLNSFRQITALGSGEHGLLELASQTAAGAPESFCQLLLPYLLQAMQLTENDSSHRPITDRHFSYRSPADGPLYRLDDALLRGTITALRSLVASEPDAAQRFLETLAADPHETAQWLLYEALTVDGERYATWTAELLLEGDYRLVSGYGGNAGWTVRQLLQAIWPYLDIDTKAALEQAILAARPPALSDDTATWIAFTLLSALPDGDLSGNARQRLAELRSEFNVDQPREPAGMHGGFIGSPIPPEAATRMSDDQWLEAMAKYSRANADLTNFTGGALELSQALKTEVAAEPERFGHLALRLTSDLDPAYGTGILQALADTRLSIPPTLVFDVIRHIASLGYEEYQDWLGWPLRRYRDDEIPDDIIQIILDRAMHATSPIEDDWLDTESHGAYYGGDIFNSGMNSARGQSALVLGDLLLHDADGHRTTLIAPSLLQLVQDPVVAVRACVGHLLLACLRHARTEATAAFWHLIEADDRLLTTQPVLDLMTYIGYGDPVAVKPVIERMLRSEHPTVRRAGGMMAAFTGLELGLDALLIAAIASADESVRTGAAEICAQRLARTADPVSATAALTQFFGDSDEDVRQAAAQVAGTLRGQALQPFADLLAVLIESPSFTSALPQLLMTLQQAPDRIDEVVVRCARRFLAEYGGQVGDLSTAAAGQVQELGRLIVRGYAQATSAAARATVLDLIDELLLRGAYDLASIVDEAER